MEDYGNLFVFISLFLTICWGVWRYRNLCLFDKANSLVLDVVDQCCEYVNSFNAIKASSQIMKMEKVLKWVPPPIGKVKLNFDGVLFRDEGKAGVGIILRNHMGHVHFALSRKEEGVFEVDEIESLAVLRGLQMVFGMGFYSIIIEGDSLTVVEDIKKGNASLASYGPIILEIVQLLHLLLDYEISHVGRQGNEAAHMLARFARNIDDSLQWWNSCPDFILNQLVLDAEN